MLKKNSYKRKTHKKNVYRRKTYKNKVNRRKNGGTLIRGLVQGSRIATKGFKDGANQVVGDVGMNFVKEGFNKTISDKHTINPLLYNYGKSPYRGINYPGSQSSPTTSDYNIQQKIPSPPPFNPTKIMTLPSTPYKGFIPPHSVEIPEDE